MVDEEPPPNPSSGMYLNTRHRRRHVCEEARKEGNVRLVEGVRYTMRQERLDSTVGEEHFQAADAARGRIALLRSGEIFADFSHKAAERFHGEKKGVLM
jgi:hypothetical protein